MLTRRTNHARMEEMMSPVEFLAESRRIFLWGYVGPENQIVGTRTDRYGVQSVATQIQLANMKSHIDPIWLYISSFGGDINQGMVLVDELKLSIAPVYTVVRSAFSMAAIIASCGERGHRYLYPNGRMMIHPSRAEAGGSVKEAENTLKEWKRIDRSLAVLLQENGVEKSLEEIMTDMEIDNWMDAAESISYGIADRIITPDEHHSLKWSDPNPNIGELCHKEGCDHDSEDISSIGFMRPNLSE